VGVFILKHGVTSLDKSENEVQMDHLHPKQVHMVKRLWKSVQYILRYSTKYASFFTVSFTNFNFRGRVGTRAPSPSWAPALHGLHGRLLSWNSTTPTPTRTSSRGSSLTRPTRAISWSYLASWTTHGHSRNDPREDVGVDVGVGACPCRRRGMWALRHCALAVCHRFITQLTRCHSVTAYYEDTGNFQMQQCVPCLWPMCCFFEKLAIIRLKFLVCPRASISQDYWGDIKEDWGSGDPSGVQGRSPGKGSGGRSPPEAEAFLWNYT